jgi:hypothetical protein
MRMATLALMVLSAVAALTSTAGAAPAPTYTVSANGGFISLGLLNNTVGVSGAGSAAAAGSGAPTAASGTGLCVEISSTTNPCPISATSPPPNAVVNTSQQASVVSAGSNNAPAQACVVPTLAVAVVTANAACGSASASEDANANPTASGEGSLANLGAALGAIPGLSALTNPLCTGSTGSPSVVTNLTTTVNNLLGQAGLSSLSALAATAGTSLTTVCGVLQTLAASTSALTDGLSTLSSTLSSLTSLSSLVKVTAGESTSTITHSTASNGDNLETVTAEAQGVDITLLNMVNLQISPNTAAVTIDTTTGIVQQPTAQTGLLSISVAGGAPTTIALPDLESVLQTVLGAVGLSGVIDPQLSVVPSSTSLSADQRSGTATSADLGLNLLGGVVSLDIGDATVSASSVAAAVAVTPTPAAAPAAVVPGPSATTVHTGEFWAGSLPIVLLSGMGLAGLMLIARRRLISAARSLTPIARHATSRSAGGLPPGPASGTSSVPPPVSGPARRQPPL